MLDNFEYKIICTIHNIIIIPGATRPLQFLLVAKATSDSLKNHIGIAILCLRILDLPPGSPMWVFFLNALCCAVLCCFGLCCVYDLGCVALRLVWQRSPVGGRAQSSTGADPPAGKNLVITQRPISSWQSNSFAPISIHSQMPPPVESGNRSGVIRSAICGPSEALAWPTWIFIFSKWVVLRSYVEFRAVTRRAPAGALKSHAGSVVG